MDQTRFTFYRNPYRFSNSGIFDHCERRRFHSIRKGSPRLLLKDVLSKARLATSTRRFARVRLRGDQRPALGSDVCQARLLEEFLEWAVSNSRELVINGDIFDDLNFKRLTKRHFACLKTIRRNSDRDDFRLIWVRGNHDGPAEIVGHVVGVEVLDEYVHDNGMLKLLILHGDQFDHFITEYRGLTDIACGIVTVQSGIGTINAGRVEPRR